MPALAFVEPEARAGSAWLAREGRDRQAELLIALLSRFNHDLRTPLNTVVGWTHLLQQGLVDNARSKHVADVLARNTREQTVLLDEFVDDGRAILGVLKMEPVSLRLEDLVTRAIDRAAPVATLHAVSFTPQFDATTTQFEGDERRMQRLVYRLLVAVARRARESAVVELRTMNEDGAVLLGIEAPAAGADWTEAALLDLRISSYFAAMHEAELTIDATAGKAALLLRLPARD